MARTRQKITAIIYDKRGRVLSIGKNSYTKTHPKQARHANKVVMPHRITLHAEMDAIIRCHDLSRAHKIFVTRITRKGKYGNAKPCPVCQSAIEEAGIAEVEWTDG